MPHAAFHELPGLGHGLFYYPEGRETARKLIEAKAAAGRMTQVLARD
jgi:hypothetical protein